MYIAPSEFAVGLAEYKPGPSDLAVHLPQSSKEGAGLDTHPSTGVYSKSTDIYDPESTLSFFGLECVPFQVMHVCQSTGW